MGLKVARRPATSQHPYGRGRAETVAAAGISLLLLAAAVGITVTSIHEIRTPHAVPAPYTLAVLLGVMLVKFLLARRTHRVGEAVDSQSVKADAWHHQSDALTSAAAFVGISIALIGGPAPHRRAGLRHGGRLGFFGGGGGHCRQWHVAPPLGVGRPH